MNKAFFVILSALVLITLPSVGATGHHAMTGEGTYLHSSGASGCATDGTILVAVDVLGTLTVTFASDDPLCRFAPDSYFDTHCATDPQTGTLTCGYKTGGGDVSSFTLYATGALVYTYEWADGRSDFLTGSVSTVP